MCVSGSKKRSLVGKFGVLCFLETSVLRFFLLPYYRRITSCITYEYIVGFAAVCYKPLMFMMELVVFYFNVFGADGKLTTLENLLSYYDSFMFKELRQFFLLLLLIFMKGWSIFTQRMVVHRYVKLANILISNQHYRNLATTE